MQTENTDPIYEFYTNHPFPPPTLNVCSFQRMSHFRIGKADSEHMSVRIVGRNNSVRDNWEVNLVDVEVEIVVGGFTGLFGAKL